MKLLTSLTITAVVGIAAAEVAQQFVACPTVTAQTFDGSCNKNCLNNDCSFRSTIRNPCDCPLPVPTARLYLPCNADCPFGGCGVEYLTLQEACSTQAPPPPQTTTRWTWPWPPIPTTSSRPPTQPSPPPPPPPSATTSRPVITTIITSLTPRPPTTPAPPPPGDFCPTITRTTRPADCPRMTCPVPTCVNTEAVVLPCGCDALKTALRVEGCPNDCGDPRACAVRTTTSKQSC